MAPANLYLTLLMAASAASAIPHTIFRHSTSSKTEHHNMMADDTQPNMMPKHSSLYDSAEQDTSMTYSADTALHQAMHITGRQAAFRDTALKSAKRRTGRTAASYDTALDPANHRTDPLETYMAPGPGLPTLKSAETYEPVTCPTNVCDCTKDTNKDPPYLQINCKSKSLKRIPYFHYTPITYDEITFSKDNNITSIRYRDFSHLKVRKIDLTDNNVNKVATNAFLGLETVLETLYLQGNGTNRIPFEKIENLTSLTNLKLGNFKMEGMYANNTFGAFEKLESLELYKMGSLTIVDAQAFNGILPALIELVFNGVGLQDIPIAALCKLQSLRKVVIHDSQIASVYANSFNHSNLQNLRELNLSHNKISFIDSNAFENVCDNLEELDLAHNLLNQTSLAAFETMKWRNLVRLNLSYNVGIGSFTSSVFRNMPWLEYLNLTNIYLQTITAEMFLGLSSLHTADLSFNLILTIKNQAFHGMPMLQDLRLGYQFHDTLSFAIELDLYPDIFDDVTTSLTDLSLENTKVRADHFWKMIRGQPSLHNLHASKTGLSIIPDNAFYHNTKLRLVDFSGNGIKELSISAFLGLGNSLTSVILHSNDLSSISECVFRDFSRLNNLILYDNKLHCDSKMCWLQDFSIQNDVKYFYSCVSPPEFKDRHLFNISELACHGRPEEICNYVTMVPTDITSKAPKQEGFKGDNSNNMLAITLAIYFGIMGSVSIVLLIVLIFNRWRTKASLERGRCVPTPGKSGKSVLSRPPPGAPIDNTEHERSDVNSKEKEQENHALMTQASVHEPKVTDNTEHERSDVNSKEKEQKNHALMTQASVHESKVIDPLKDQKEKIYRKINGPDTVPRTYTTSIEITVNNTFHSGVQNGHHKNLPTAT